MTRCDLSAWVPRGVDERAGAFARVVVEVADPASWARARSLLWAASRLCDVALGWGLAPEPCVLLQGALIERFIVRGTPGWSAPARRTARSNLLFLAHRFFALAPEPVPLARERAQEPYSEAQLARYLALADAQPTAARRAKASGLIALGAGAGLIGADLRAVTGSDVVTRSGGVLVEVRARAPRTVPVRCRALRARPCGSSVGRDGVHRGRGRAQPAQRHEPPHRLARRRSGSAEALPRPPAFDVGGPLCGRHRPGHLHGRRRCALLAAPGRCGGPPRSR